MKKVISFFKTDVKIINSYFLLAVILIILISIGYSSYALFSFTKTSGNVIEGKVGKINYTTNFSYTGECTTYIAKSDGYYNLEVWGAQGGNYNTTYVGGLGGYSKGIVQLTKGTTLYVCVGGQPQTVTTASVAVPGGFNGGGNGFNRAYSGTYTYGQAGGGATDIRIGQNSLYARVIVAGGGSGSNNRISGYAGGGLSGVTGQSGYAGTQTSAGTGGSFGQGGSATTSGSNYRYGASGGGGGFYGGGAIASYSDSTNYDKYTGGGSGYVYTSSTASSYPSGCLLNSTYYLTASSTTEGINTGNGKATITYIGKEITIYDTSGANAPVLASNMIPVYYDETQETWKKANKDNMDKTNPWYSYNSTGEYKGMWANAVTVKDTNRQTYLNATPGTIIPMDDITTMWVWIPRFNAVTPSNYNGGTKEKPNAIDVTFVKQNETAIDAFTFGTKELSGFWYGKFEVSHTTLASSTTDNNLGCTNETCSNANGIIIKPNETSLRYNNVSNFFFASRSMEQTGNSFGFVKDEVDTHMSKNNEWGAVAYLTQSIYGRCTSSTSCTEVGINNNKSYITGYGAPAGSDTSVTNGAYNTTLGKDASTTGTIYGIYDMSGGAWEYVMGVYNKTISSSGFNSLLDEKYYNNYTGSSYTGHALTETKNWYSDVANFVKSSHPWFARSGDYYGGTGAGVFYFSNINGISSGAISSRLVISNE
ncbi:MAG TPA: glycine rich domain-containing protein [Bacilli bacterium]|nr:glycine rich domain-containing protein [Bacilli bacterium]